MKIFLCTFCSFVLLFFSPFFFSFLFFFFSLLFWNDCKGNVSSCVVSQMDVFCSWQGCGFTFPFYTDTWPPTTTWYLWHSHPKNDMYWSHYFPPDCIERDLVARPIKGRLLVCSNSILFDPQDQTEPILKFPYRKCETIRRWEAPLMSASKTLPHRYLLTRRHGGHLSVSCRCREQATSATVCWCVHISMTHNNDRPSQVKQCLSRRKNIYKWSK